MRWQHLKEGFQLIALIAILGLFFFDEEPLIDASDWNALHCVLLLFSLMAVVWENVTRARYGQFIHKDQVLLFSTFSFWFFLENYFRAIVVIFCIHSLCPLEIDLLETVEVYQLVTRWLVTTILPTLVILSTTLFMALMLNASIGWARIQLLIFLSCFICISLMVNIFFMSWDLISTGMTSVNWFCECEEFYLQPKTLLTQNHYTNVQDQYDWHREKSYPFVMKFEDLLFFYIQVFNLLTLLCCLLVWLSLTIDLITLGENAVSYTYIAVGIKWLEHAALNISLSFLFPVFIGLRVSLRTPFEFWFLLV